ncbi:hypothetical protein [Actinoplanes sp. NPDC026623]|uniref:hypothetical protein n=1 Tax=Actinoplanes sp. NPDC026623 TaxID=3155610 RepID=UPI0033DD906D
MAHFRRPTGSHRRAHRQPIGLARSARAGGIAVSKWTDGRTIAAPRRIRHLCRSAGPPHRIGATTNQTMRTASTFVTLRGRTPSRSRRTTMGNTTKRTATVAAAVVLSVGAGTAAFAYASGWFQGGGTVNAASAGIQNVTTTITVANTVQNRLFPGKTISVSGDIVNPNEYKIKITGATVTGVTSTKNGSNNGGCATATADLSAALTVVPLEINAGATANNKAFTLKMGENAAAACADSVLTATLTFAGELVP